MVKGDLLSLILYLTLFFVSSTLLFFGHKYHKKYLNAFGLFLLIALMGLRYKTGIDTDNYQNIYKILSNISWDEYLNTGYRSIYEPFTFILAQLSSVFSRSSLFFFTFYSVTTILFFYFGVKRILPKYSWLALLFYCLLFLSPAMNGMRQFAAISVVFYATTLIMAENQTNKTLRFCALIFFGFLLHSSAICFLCVLPLYWLNKKISKLPTITVLLFYLSAATVMVVLGCLLIQNIQYLPILNRYTYLLEFDMANTPKPNLISRSAPFIIFLAFLFPLCQKDRTNSLFLGVLSLLALLFSLIGFIVPYGYRISDYFLVFQILLFIKIIASSEEGKLFRVYITLFMLYCLGYFIYSAFINNSHGIFPYNIIFSKFMIYIGL